MATKLVSFNLLLVRTLRDHLLGLIDDGTASVNANPGRPGSFESWLGDRVCDAELNTLEFDFDDGDCCDTMANFDSCQGRIDGRQCTCNATGLGFYGNSY